jgi:hypothetical protein
MVGWSRSQSGSPLAQKYELVIYFLFHTVIVVALTALVNFVGMINGFWLNVRVFLIEIGCLVLFVMQMRFFFYSSNHVPE